MDTPLSESNVSLRLAEIQRRCAELMDAEGDSELEELSLEEDVPADQKDDPRQHCIER